MYDPCLGVWHGVDPLLEIDHSISSYVFCKNNPLNRTDLDGRWSISNHYKMTMKGLAKFGINGNQAFLLAYYASVYADNPGSHMKWNNIFHPRYMMDYLSDIDHSETVNSQVSGWRPGSPGMNENIRHSMRPNWEADAYEQGIDGGISQEDAQLRGMQYGWENIFNSAGEGHLANFKKTVVESSYSEWDSMRCRMDMDMQVCQCRSIVW